jgi:MFS family permease
MRPRVFYGWTIVSVCFLIALFGWGLGFYGPGLYLAWLQAQHGWSTTLMSSAVTGYYLLSATCIIFIGTAMERFGPRLVVLVGSMAMGLGVVGLTVIRLPWVLLQTACCHLSPRRRSRGSTWRRRHLPGIGLQSCVT